MAKTVKSVPLPNSNLNLLGKGRDRNGNITIKLSFSNEKPFSIKTDNGMFPHSHYHLGRSSIYGMEYFMYERISKEVCAYIEQYGSKKQKKLLVRS